jgi:hypothetical protein
MNHKINAMKKVNVRKGIAITAAMFICGVSFAQQQQTTAESTLTPKFGIKGGVNLTNLFVDEVNDEHVRVGLNGGVYAKLPVTRGFSIQPELIYSGKGAKLEYDNLLQGQGEYRFNLHYVELPVLAMINVAPNFNIHAGPYVSYLAGANISELKDGSVNNIKDLKADDFNRFDYGLAGGVGLDIENFTIGARYNYGLHEIGKSGSLSGQLTKNSKNSAFQLYIGIGL